MKRKFLIAAGVLLGLLGLGVAALFVFIDPDDIKDQALVRAREATGYTIEAGPASLKLGFTGAGVRLQEVFLESPDTLQTIRADHVDVLVKILPLLGRKVELSSISVGNGHYVRRSPAGTMTLDKLNVSGSFAWDDQTGGAGNLGGDLGGGSFEGNAGTYPIPATGFSARFEMSANQDRFVLSEVKLESGGLKGIFAGEYERAGMPVEAGRRGSGDEGWEGELRGSLDTVKWSELVALLPPETMVPLGDAEIEGKLAVPEVTVRTEGETTTTSGVLTFSDLSVKAPSAPLGLSGGRGTVRFSPKKVALEDGQGRLGDNPVKLTGSLSGTENKFASVHVDTRIDGATLGKLMPEDAGVSLSRGSVVVDLGARGAFPFEGVPLLDGTIQLDGLEGTYGELPLRETGGKVSFAGKRVAIEGLRASLGRSDFTVSGQAPDIANPWFRFSLESNVLDVNELFPEEDRTKKQEREAGPAIGLPGTGTVRIGTLHVRKLELQNVRGDVRMALDGVDLTKLRGSAYGGDVSGGLAMRPAETAGTWRYEGGFDLSQVGIGDILLGWSDLGRVVEGGLNGKLSLDGLMGAGIDARSAFNLNGDFGMRNGTFKNLPVLLSLAQAFRIKGVDQTWPFKTIDANLTVKDGKMVLNSFQLAQAGFDWTLEGLIGLDGSLDLSGTVIANPGQVDFPLKGVVVDYLALADGRIPIPFKVGGNLRKPSAAPDRAAIEKRVAEKAKEDVNNELRRRLGVDPGSEVDKFIQGVDPDSSLKKSLGGLLKGKGGG